MGFLLVVRYLKINKFLRKANEIDVFWKIVLDSFCISVYFADTSVISAAV